MDDEPPKEVADMTDEEFRAAVKAAIWRRPQEKPKLPDAHGLSDEEFRHELWLMKQGKYST